METRQRESLHATKDQTWIQRLSQAIAASLKGDSRRRVEAAGAEVETLLGSNPEMPREAWQRLKGWYKAAVHCAPPPARVTLDWITAERVDLYSYVLYPGTNIPISVEPVPVDDSVPTEDKIEGAVKHIRRNRSGVPSGMRDEHLKGWLAALKRRKKEVAEEGEGTTDGEEGGSTDTNWERLVDLVQTAFREGRMAEEATWQAVVMIPKGKKDYRGIGLVEVMWKVVSEVLNFRLIDSITYHDFLHGFRADRGTGTATL